MHPTPKTVDELMQRAQNIAGQFFADLAEEANMTVPEDLTRNKGWVGQLIEWHLGVTAGSKAEPDFLHLGIELKTLPIDHTGKPLESTFVSVAPLTGAHGLTWEKCHVRQKLARVLWVPILGTKSIPLAQRQVGTPFLWTPTPEQEHTLRQDWEEHMEKIALGEVERITAHSGEALQIRPKAANSHALTDGIDQQGNKVKTLPRGFYLRSRFTHHILQQAFHY